VGTPTAPGPPSPAPLPAAATTDDGLGGGFALAVGAIAALIIAGFLLARWNRGHASDAQLSEPDAAAPDAPPAPVEASREARDAMPSPAAALAMPIDAPGETPDAAVDMHDTAVDPFARARTIAIHIEQIDPDGA
jgi:hypothetical protein